jgi:hypothetical protein
VGGFYYYFFRFSAIFSLFQYLYSLLGGRKTYLRFVVMFLMILIDWWTFHKKLNIILNRILRVLLLSQPLFNSRLVKQLIKYNFDTNIKTTIYFLDTIIWCYLLSQKHIAMDMSLVKLLKLPLRLSFQILRYDKNM